jgi:microcompartment protein CcmL/EutN
MIKGNSLGIIELASIGKGFEVQDAILKAANVEKIIARTICSGKYFIAIRGDVADVESAVSVAKEIGGFSIVNTATIPNLDPKVFPAIAGTTVYEQGEKGKHIGALLIIETFSVVSAIKAADLAVKEAELDLLRVHVAMAIGGKGFLVITGDISSLEAAAQPAVNYCKEDGMLADYSLIKNPHEDVLRELI